MDLKQSLAGQFRAGLAMLRECVEGCPDDLWAATVDKPPRTYWRIAYHATFYTHFYLSQTRSEFTPWGKHVGHAVMTFAEEGEELPPEGTLYTQADVLEYIDYVSERISGLLDALDLESAESGFPWYPKFAKLDHVFLTLRHLGVHVGQLQELLFARGIEPDWISRR
ncbi:MAG: DinB family protein [Armatimonadetes bacterium]|nr:DinB family protein [Armatimonadota bacterium]